MGEEEIVAAHRSTYKTAMTASQQVSYCPSLLLSRYVHTFIRHEVSL